MVMSDHLSVQQALCNVMLDVHQVGKTERNTSQGYEFRGVDAVLNAVAPALRTHGVVVLPTECETHYQVVPVGKQQNPMREATVKVTYSFVGPAGDSLSATVWAEALDSGDKATAKAMSVAFRTMLIQSLAIPTGDKDPDSETYKRAQDPLTQAKNTVMAAASRKGWDMDQLSQDFAEWSHGGDIRTADVDTLTAYASYLIPPKKMRRKGGDTSE